MRPLGLVAGLVLATGAAGVRAGPISYGDFVGADVTFTDVTETANTPGDTEPLLGPPGLAGNALSFSPSNLAASASSGAADPTDGQLDFTVEASGRPTIRSIALSAGGVETLQGSGGSPTRVGYALSLASVTVLEVDYAPLAVPVVLPSASTSGSDHLAMGSEADTAWSLCIHYDVDAALADAGILFTNGATKLELSIDSMLVAISEPASLASIGGVSFEIEINAPAPAAPTLTIVRSGPGEVAVSWNPALPCFVLQESVDLTPGAWADAPSGSTNPVMIPITGERRFFRLSRIGP